MSSEYERIYLNQSKMPGRMRIADSGLGWKAQSMPGSTTKTTPFLLPSDEIASCYWSRGSRGYEMRIDTKNKGVIILDGFDERDSTGLKHELSKNFNVQLEVKEHALRGWNWGKIQMARNELVFNVANKPAYEIPYAEISNANLSGRNEVSVEMDLMKNDDTIERTGDELVEVKFYIPGNADAGDEMDIDAPEGDKKEKIVKKDGDVEVIDDDDENNEDTEKSGKTKTKAELFVEELKSKADITQVVGEIIVSFSEVLFLTPRGRYDIDMYDNFLRLRGKTYDYKLQYIQIQRIFSLPKLDGMHHLIVLQVNPPLRQGQTKYSFLTLQFDEQEEIEVELNLSEEDFEETYKGRINKSYSSTTHLVLSNLFKGFTERRVVLPGSYQSKDGLPGISCSLKANEGHLYALEKCALFLTKPTVLIPYSEVGIITFSRVGQGSAQKTFDMEISTINGGPTHNFGNIERAEQPLLESFFRSKNLKVRNDEKIAQEMLANAMVDSDGEADLGSADDESPDEDFNGGSGSDDSDVDEEYDSDVASDAEDNAGGDNEPKTKKQKKEEK
ncbi:FACT complex subunit [Pichia californica]|uniref:FACT complex subunit POB3 n=1 Tax=Pichia californica TaxID=460514 RepID=A0A9P6WQQ0_9ASCO|nr:FACT complex subunit [[Candida] californica]KAG0691406.1 FACT complex subunit [[Candida] californica]